MKKFSVFFVLIVINTIILSCKYIEEDKSLLDRYTLSNIIADIYIARYIHLEDAHKSNSGTVSNYYLDDQSLEDINLRKIYQKYNTNRFNVYKTYTYYLKDGDAKKLNALKEIYKLAENIITNKKRELTLLNR